MRIIQKEMYVCQETGKEFKTPEEAIASEKKAQTEKNTLEYKFRQVFPKSHPKDTNLRHYCNGCDRLISKLEPDWQDNMRYSDADPLWRIAGGIYELFGGRYCKECHGSYWTIIQTLLIKNKHRFKSNERLTCEQVVREDDRRLRKSRQTKAKAAPKSEGVPKRSWWR